MNSLKFLRTTILQNIWGRLLLMMSGHCPDGHFPDRHFPDQTHPRQTLPPRESSPTDTSSTDISPTRHFGESEPKKNISSRVSGHFHDGHFPTDISLTRHIPDGYFPRSETSPMDTFPTRYIFSYSLFNCNIFPNYNFYLHS